VTIIESNLTKDDFKRLCKLNYTNKYAEECLRFVDDPKSKFLLGIIKDRAHMASLYRFRYNNAKSASKLDVDVLKEYSDAVES
jgi:hypothetical protein